MACTKFPWGRCTRASSNPDISASRSSAKRCCGWRSAWATRTRASKSASRRCRWPKGHRLAGRVSGDSTVAYAWAYAQALEAIADVAIPTRAAWLRALALERERLANHLGDLGYLGNDGGFAFGLAQFSRLKEDVLRTNLAAFGHRLLMDHVVPGGVARDLAPSTRRGSATNARRWNARSGSFATSMTSTPACRTAFARAASCRRRWRPSSA